MISGATQSSLHRDKPGRGRNRLVSLASSWPVGIPPGQARRRWIAIADYLCGTTEAGASSYGVIHLAEPEISYSAFTLRVHRGVNIIPRHLAILQFDLMTSDARLLPVHA